MESQISYDERARVEALIFDSGHHIDNDCLEEWADLFIDDCLYKVTTRESVDQELPVGVIFCEGIGMVRDRILALRKANIFNPHYDRHLIGSVRITGKEDKAFLVESSYIVLQTTLEGESKIFSTGKYLDKVVIRNGEARFKERLVIADTAKVDNLLAIPL